MNKKDKLDNGYRLDDFGLLFSDEKSKKRDILLRRKDNMADSANQNNPSLRADSQNLRGNPPIEKGAELQQGLPRSHLLARNDEKMLDSAKIAESNMPPKKPQSKETKEQDFIYAPQFQGFDEILEESKDFGVQDFNTQDFGTQDFNTQDFGTQDFGTQKQGAESSSKSQISPQSEKDLLLRHPHTQNDTNALFIAYSILFLMLLAFMPQIYLANNIYTSSKNINLLKAQKDALRDENSDLQKKLESLKFNFLTLEIEEIK